MAFKQYPIPRLATSSMGALYPIEKNILDHVATIEHWFREQWKLTPPPLTSSVDLRHEGFKLAPVDTNLFPAGYNNLNPDLLSLCVLAAQSTLKELMPACTKILLLPENHTRNQFYLQSLWMLQDIFTKAGFIVRVGSLDDTLQSPLEVSIGEAGERLLIEPVKKQANRLRLDDFDPCFLLLNNDLSSGVPTLLEGIEQKIFPPIELGWVTRRKSDHFQYYQQVVQDFSHIVGVDPWLMTPMFFAHEDIDFMSQQGIEVLAKETAALLQQIQKKYDEYQITEKPFVAVKADNGTYGMNVLMIHDADELLHLNRKQRTRMAAGKGSRKVERVIVQEGVYTYETMPDGSVAEPVVYMIGSYVVGGFYRVHHAKGATENLNSPGMHFEPLAFTEPCNMPCSEYKQSDDANRFYVYGVIARLAALAAAREVK